MAADVFVIPLEKHGTPMDKMKIITIIISIVVIFSMLFSVCGTLLFYLFADNLDMFATSLDFNGISNIITIRTGISVILALVIFYNYLVAQSDHVGIKRNVIISQITIFAMFIFFVVSFIQTLKTGVLVSDIFFYIAQISTYIMIVCIETKVQIYKGIRMKLKSENAWNDETRKENKKD